MPPKRVLNGDVDENDKADVDSNLVCILNAAKAILRDAYKMCSDISPSRKIAQQRANILNAFYAGASGKSAGFRYFKNISTLRLYFAKIKQLLAYFYRVVYHQDGHFM